MAEPHASSLDELVEQVTTWSYGMPVRLMERVLAIGETAVPTLTAALGHMREDEERDVLWLIVLLGELRHPDGVPALLDQMRRTEDDVLAMAAADALAKIGAAAVESLIELTKTGDTLERLYAYLALGRIHDDRAFVTLTAALEHDRELGDVLAIAVADQDRAEAMPLLYDAYTRCDPKQRPEFEAALRVLHEAPALGSARRDDWRLRYRRSPELGGIVDLEWAGVLAVVHSHTETMPERELIPVRPLDAILAETVAEDDMETCEDCGAPIEYHTGLPACPGTAVAVAVFQVKLLADAQQDEIDDVFEWLDELEADELDLWDDGEPRTATARERWREQVNELQMGRQTGHWLIEQGVESVSGAKAVLLAHAMRLAERFGDPERLLEPVSPSRARGPKVGRNDPCPCGSGRKYKRCCLDKV